MKIYNKIKLVVLLFIINIFSFAQDYHRITSLNLSSDEMLVALVEPSKIVALSSKISEDEDMSNITNIAKNFPKLEKNLESILNSNPDLVIGADWIDSSLIQSIKDAGIDVYIYKTPTISTATNFLLLVNSSANINFNPFKASAFFVAQILSINFATIIFLTP